MNTEYSKLSITAAKRIVEHNLVGQTRPSGDCGVGTSLINIISFKPTGTKACLRERILGGAYFNEGVCDVNHNSLQFGTRILVCTIMRPAATVPHIDWF